jgi:hypothetical protein
MYGCMWRHAACRTPCTCPGSAPADAVRPGHPR